MKKQIIALIMALFMVFGIFPLPAQAESSDKKLAAITFDDGPSKYTDGLLDELAKRDVVVTFFMQGCNAEKYSSVVKKLTRRDIRLLPIHTTIPSLLN